MSDPQGEVHASGDDVGIPGSRRLANATRAASGPSVKLLSPPSASPPWLTTHSLEPDARIGRTGRVRPLRAYDLGLPPPPLPADAAGEVVQSLGVHDTLEFVLDRAGPCYLRTKPLRMYARKLLNWLAGFDGASWEERWVASGADAAPETWRIAVYGHESTAVKVGINALLIAGVLRPSYGWQLHGKGGPHFEVKVLDVHDPENAPRLRDLPAFRQALPRHRVDAEAALARVAIRTGRRLDQLRGEDLLQYADVVQTSGRARREHLAWELLVALGTFAGEPPTLRAAWSAKGNTRQHSPATLVDRYGIPQSGVRDLLVDYLGEVSAGMDYSSLAGLAYRLARLFWWQVLEINPQQQDLRLDAATATAWRERLAVTTDGRPRREIHSTLFAIRALYRDLAEWSHEEPVRWGVWVAPCPVPRRESRHASKAKRRQRADAQARTRALTPLLPLLVAEATRRKDWFARLLAAATTAEDGQRFSVDDAVFERSARPPRLGYQVQSHVWARTISADPTAPGVPLEGGRVNVHRLEEKSFWGWAVIETLRHTGIRVEELQELTQLSLRHYTSAATGTLVPLLHIVPSKNDIERLIPMSPELVDVLLAVLRRARGGESQVPLSVRYDHHEKVHGEPFPHLFARRVGARQEVLSTFFIRNVLNEVAAGAQLADGGQQVSFTPHDFRRLFSTEVVAGGLPLHIAATLLGHLSLETSRGYTAVFPAQVIAAHQHFVERRRQRRPDGEMRDATEHEWREFEDHFLLRKVALGDCRRPYGTPCVHEHACTRCRFLKVDPAELPRIEEMAANVEARLVEARDRGWLGEVAALEDSITHLRRRHAEACDQLLADRARPTPVGPVRVGR